MFFWWTLVNLLHEKFYKYCNHWLLSDKLIRTKKHFAFTLFTRQGQVLISINAILSSLSFLDQCSKLFRVHNKWIPLFKLVTCLICSVPQIFNGTITNAAFNQALWSWSSYNFLTVIDKSIVKQSICHDLPSRVTQSATMTWGRSSFDGKKYAFYQYLLSMERSQSAKLIYKGILQHSIFKAGCIINWS